MDSLPKEQKERNTITMYFNIINCAIYIKSEKTD